jgi:hypothetical protein
MLFAVRKLNTLSSEVTNMKKALAILLISIWSFTIVGCAHAGNTRDPGIRERIAEQQARIDEGISSGQLTRHEANILQDNLNWIKTEEARLKADGRLTPEERARLHRMLDKNSAMIYRKKHNPIVRLY